jgi:transposase
VTEGIRQFVRREAGEETSVFTGRTPRQAALKAARRLQPAPTRMEARTNQERIHLREHGTIRIHSYDAWAWTEPAEEDDPDWLGETVTRANVSKVDLQTVAKSEAEFDYDRLEPHLNDNPIAVTQDRCERCGASLDTVRQVVPVKEILDPPTTRYKRHHYECENCTNQPIAQQGNCPSRGRYGVNLLAQAVLFRYEYRIPYRKIAALFEQLYDCETSKATALHLCERVAEVARREYDALNERIRSADILYADETPHSVGDENHWLWAFTTGEETLFAFSDTRGSEVLESVLGTDFTGIIACDGHRAYPAFHARLQRCWTHLLRGSDRLDEDDTEAWAIYDALQELFHGLKRFLDTDPSAFQRIVVQRAAREYLEELVATSVDSEDATEVLTMVENGLGDWLTFLDFPAVEPTNHKVEALLREPIVLRNVIGTLRNEKGMWLHETFLSLLETWRQQDRDPYGELQRLARQV